MRTDKKSSQRSDKKTASRGHKQGVVGYSKKSALLEDAITQMNAGKYGRSSAALKELLALDPLNMEARRLFATLHLRLGSLIPARQAFESLINEAFERQDYWLAESLLREYLAAGPRCVPFLEKLGTIYQDKGDALAAVTEYGKAIDILIEDPDPDHPQLAAQLYAKVRELAPASPVAFRLANFFDAQSGELVVHGNSAQPEPASSASASAPVVQESGPEIPTTDETQPASDFTVASDESIESPTTASDSFPSPTIGGKVADSSGIQAVSEQSPPEAGEPYRQEAAMPAGAPMGNSLVDDMSAALAESVKTQPAQDQLSPDLSTPSVQLDPSPETPSISFAEFPSPETPQADNREVRSVDSVSSGLDGQGTKEPGQADPGLLSVPMPWERVEESGITIPERELEPPPQVAAALESTHPATAQSVDSSNVEDRAHVEGVPRGDSSTPVSELPSSSSVSENQAKEGFSWESVFARAWNFGGTPSSLDQKEDTPNVEIVPAENSGPAAAASPSMAVDDQAQIPSALALPVDTESASTLPSESVAGPMPWDQVQDATIRIVPSQEAEPPPSSVAGEVARSLPETLESGSPDLPIGTVDATQPDIAPTTAPAGLGSGTLSASESAPSDETPFRLIENLPASSHSESEAALAEVEPITQSPLPAEAPSMASEPPALAEAALETVTEAPPPAAAFSGVQSVQPSEQSFAAPEPPAESLSPSPAADTVSDALHLRDENASTSVSTDPTSVAPPQERPLALEQPVHWKTGEVAVQTHRPAQKKRKRSSVPEQEPAADGPSVDGRVQDQPASVPQQEPISDEPPAQSREAAPESDAWASASDSIRFVESPVSTVESSFAPEPVREDSLPAQPVTAAVSAVDVLFDSTQRTGRSETHERVAPKPRFRLGATLNRIRIGVFVFLRSCFSTTRAVVTTVAALGVLSTAILVLGLGMVGMAWLAMEEKPTPAYQSLTTVPQRFLTDPKNNGYLFLLGFDAPPSIDPVQAGYERKPGGKDADLAAGCISGRGASDDRMSSGATKNWFSVSDPAAQFRRNQDLMKGWMSQGEPVVGRYKQWLTMRFDDWGYGQSVSPPCAAILSAHRLFVADGFAQGPADSGVDRLEADMEAWRATLSQAKTLPVKAMALQAINEDVAVASGLLVRPDADGIAADRFAKMLRPLDQMELSLRWPIQSQFVAATKTLEARLRADRVGPAPLYARIASALPLPKQRLFNDYARYYEASYKAAGEGRFGSLPKRTNYVRSPAGSLMDVLRNPLENLIGLEPLADWEFYSGLVVDTDARLRLASLQVWLRRSPQGANLMAQIAKAGQSFYDPYTGYPMLVNSAKGVIYSVGHDGKDQDGDPQTDVVAAVPPGIALSARTPPTSPGPR